MPISLIKLRRKHRKRCATATTPQVAIDSCLSHKMRAGLPEEPPSVWRHYFIAEHAQASKRAFLTNIAHFRPCDLSAPTQVDIVFRTARIRSRSIVPLSQTANWRGAKIGKSDSRTCTQQRGLTSGLPETSLRVWQRGFDAEHVQSYRARQIAVPTSFACPYSRRLPKTRRLQPHHTLRP
jgi:hypothetical protein